MKRQEYAIADRLPESLNRDNLREVAQVIDEKMHELDMLSEIVCLYPRIDELSSELVDALAIQFHVDFYDTTLSLEKRRELVKNSIRWHMKKGTKSVVQELVETVFDSGVVSEWFEYGGAPYHFRVTLQNESDITPEKLALVAKVANAVKNVRSWLDGIGFKRETTGRTYYGGAPYIHKKYSIGPAKAHDAHTEGTNYIGGVSHIYKRYKVEQNSIHDTSVNSPYKAGGGVYMYKKYRIEEE